MGCKGRKISNQTSKLFKIEDLEYMILSVSFSVIRLQKMQEMCRQKLLYCAQNIENQRMTNVGTELERLIAMLLQLSNLTCVDEGLGLAEEALQKLQVASQNETDSTRRVPDTSYGTVGRPKYIIPLETLDMLLESGLKVNDIANMFNVSKRTIERRMHECQLSVGQTYSTITDEQ